MKQSSLLRSVEYADLNTLVNIVIDLEQGTFSLDGSWAYISATAKNAGQNWYSPHQDNIKIKNELFPAQVVDMNDVNFKDAIYTMKGAILDGESANSSSGIIFLEKQRGASDKNIPVWVVTIYLFDFSDDENEIKIQFPVFPSTTVAANN